MKKQCSLSAILIFAVGIWLIRTIEGNMMDETYFWLIFGAAAFLLTGANLVRTFMGKRRGWMLLLFTALSCGALSLLEAYRMVAAWFARGDMAALYDVVPTLTKVLPAALYVGLALNLFILIFNLWKTDRFKR